MSNRNSYLLAVLAGVGAAAVAGYILHKKILERCFKESNQSKDWYDDEDNEDKGFDYGYDEMLEDFDSDSLDNLVDEIRQGDDDKWA